MANPRRSRADDATDAPSQFPSPWNFLRLSDSPRRAVTRSRSRGAAEGSKDGKGRRGQQARGSVSQAPPRQPVAPQRAAEAAPPSAAACGAAPVDAESDTERPELRSFFSSRVSGPCHSDWVFGDHAEGKDVADLLLLPTSYWFVDPNNRSRMPRFPEIGCEKVVKSFFDDHKQGTSVLVGILHTERLLGYSLSIPQVFIKLIEHCGEVRTWQVGPDRWIRLNDETLAGWKQLGGDHEQTSVEKTRELRRAAARRDHEPQVFSETCEAIGCVPDLDNAISTLAVYDAVDPTKICIRQVRGITLADVFCHYVDDAPYEYLMTFWLEGKLLVRAISSAARKRARRERGLRCGPVP